MDPDPSASPDYGGASEATEEAEAAAGMVAEAAADAVLDSAVAEDSPLVRLRGLPWSYCAAEVSGSPPGGIRDWSRPCTSG